MQDKTTWMPRLMGRGPVIFLPDVSPATAEGIFKGNVWVVFSVRFDVSTSHDTVKADLKGLSSLIL